MSAIKKCNKKSIYEEYFDIVESSISKYGKDTIVLIMIGDFYELYEYVDENNKRFGANLDVICEITDFIKTKKNKEKESSMKNPFMTGAPIRSVSKIINKCLKRNYTIVIIEQTSESPKPTREITQIISPSMYIDEIEKDNKFLMIIYVEINNSLNTKKKNYSCGLTAIDCLTNELIFYEIHCDDINECLNEITRFYMFYDPKELVIYEINNSKTNDIKISNCINLKYNQCVKKYYSIDPNYEKPKYQNLVFNKVYKNDGLLSPIENLNLEKYHYSRISLVITFEYIFQRNEKLLYSIKNPVYYGDSDYMILYNNAQYQLNIIDNNNPDINNFSFNSLNDVINCCITPMGKRYLKNRLCNPYTNYEIIKNYYDLSEKMIKNGKTENVRILLKSVYDLQKLFRKLIIKHITLNELFKIYVSIKNCLEIITLLNDTNIKSDIEKLFNNNNVETLKNSIEYLEKTFYIENFHQMTLNDLSNSIYKKGIYKDIDLIQSNISNGDDVLDKIADRFREFDETIDISIENKTKGKKTDIGYFLRTKLKDGIKLKKLLENMGSFKLDDFCEINYEDINFKELKSEMRITFLKLNNESDQIAECKTELNKLCRNYYIRDIKKWYDGYEIMFSNLLKYIIKIDYVCNNVYVSNKYHYSKPEIVKSEESFLESKELRHPIIERLIDYQYIGNDIIMDEKNNGQIIYGINSSGKTSVMRSLGIAIIMSQSGMYVACDYFKFSIFKKLFVRISGNDDMFRALSSFTLEISEMNNIYNDIDNNSIILCDELCKGSEITSSTAIVAASIMFLLEKKARFIITSHLHELLNLNKIKQAVDNLFLKIYHLSVDIDKDDNIKFNRKLQNGSGLSSYGLLVAKNMIKNNNIIDMAYEFKNEILKMDGINTNIVNSKISRYNNNFYVNMCSICNSTEKLEVHHILQQKNFNNDGFNNENLKILKDSESNLAVLCQKCHDDLHGGKIKIKRKVKTSKGVIFE